MVMRLGRRALMTGMAGALATPALAQARFPDRPLRMMVPWTPGGATDIQMRALCEQAAKRLGQPIIVENKPGAGGSLAAQFLAREARADGYTLAQMSNGTFRMPLMQERPQWDPMQDFTWVIRLVGYMGGVVVRRDAPWRTMQELLADARANPGKFNYGTPGANTTDIQMTRLARLAGIDWVTVPFRGAAPTCVADASTARLSFACGSGCESNVVFANAALLPSKAACISGDQVSRSAPVPLPRRLSISGLIKLHYL